MAESVLYERRGVATLLTINRPEARNAVNGAVAQALLDGYRRFPRPRRGAARLLAPHRHQADDRRGLGLVRRRRHRARALV